ncbi:MAG: VTT domain-containing protein [Clostridiales bacterium]|nr:VTT domain-containing protein [Clostridiales bacterium]
MTTLTVILIYQESLELRFDYIVEWLTDVERAVSSLGSEVQFMLALLALYLAKAWLPLPLTFLCVIAGMAYPSRYAFLINMYGMLLVLTIKYFEGKYMGAGWFDKLLNHNRTGFLKKTIEHNGSGNPYVLFGTRLVSFLPINFVSRIYGSLGTSYVYYACISLIGLIPRIYTYTRLGGAVFNPFSREFIILMMILVVFLGVSGIGVNIYYGSKINQMNQISVFMEDNSKYKVKL